MLFTSKKIAGTFGFLVVFKRFKKQMKRLKRGQNAIKKEELSSRGNVGERVQKQ